MKNKILYGLLIFIIIVSDLAYINAFATGGFIPDDTSNLSNSIIPLLFVISLISLIVGLTKIKKQKILSWTLIILSLPTVVSSLWMYTHIDDFSPKINTFLKAKLASARVYAEYEHESSNSYLNACANIDVIQHLDEIKDRGVETKCFSDNDSYVMAIELINRPKKKDQDFGMNYFCVDSKMNTIPITTSQYESITTANTICSIQ